MGDVINSPQTITGTEQYIYRNSSIKKGGLRANVGFTLTNTDLSISGTEGIEKVQDSLTEADRDLLRANMSVIQDCALDRMCANADTLEARANRAWDRAIDLYPVMRDLLDDEIEAIRFETLQRINMAEYQWRRLAGSSLNCAVLQLQSSAQNELAVRLAGVVSEALQRYKVHETEAIAQAFAHNLQARLEPAKVMFSHTEALWNVLRGARVEDTTDREYEEQRGETTMVTDARGEYYNEATAIADNSGTYAGDADDAYSAAGGVL